MRAHVARQIEQFVGGEIGGGNAVQDLLIGRIRRLGRAPVFADQRRDRSAVDDVEAVERAAARSDADRSSPRRSTSMSSSSMRSHAAKEWRRSGRSRKAVIALMRLVASAARCAGSRGRTAKPEAAIWSLRVSMIVRSSGRASASARRFGKADRLVRARRVVDVDAEGIVELPALHLGRRHRRERLLRPEPGRGRDARYGVARGGRRGAQTGSASKAS